MARILVLEDELDIADLVTELLRKRGHIVEHVADGDDAIAYLRSAEFDLLVLDINVKGSDGLQVLQFEKQHRAHSKVLMLTSKSAIEDRLAGFAGGADDYLPKPFDSRELLARVEALLKRPAEIITAVLKHGSLELDTKSRTIRRNGEEIKLQRQDLILLEFFILHRGETFSSDALLDRVWPVDSRASIDGLRMCVSRLRKAIDSPDTKTSIIETVGRTGYRLGEA